MSDRITHYRHMRAWPDPLPARVAWHSARAKAGEFAPAGYAELRAQVREAIDDIGAYWSSRARITVDGYDVEITVDDDDTADTSYLGEYVTRWEPGAIEVQGRDMYFVPTQTLDERRAWHRASGHTRHDAYTRARAEVLADLDLANRLTSSVVIVSVSRVGITLATDSIGGIDIDPHTPVDERLDYIADAATECVLEAIHAAQEAEARLIATIEKIEGTVTLADGSTSEFHITLEYGWSQWGASSERLGRTVDLLDQIERVMHEVAVEDAR